MRVVSANGTLLHIFPTIYTKRNKFCDLLYASLDEEVP